MQFINKSNFYKVVIIFILLFTLTTSQSFANKSAEDIDKENEFLYEKIMEYEKDDDNTIDNIINDMKKKEQEGIKPIKLENISDSIYVGSIRLSIIARKYIVPITLLVIFFYIFMLSATGAKNIKNRKKYIFGIGFFYLFCLMILNLPLYILWRSSITTVGLMDFEKFYNLVDSISRYLKDNSFVYFSIIFAFGMVNRISSETNLPKRLASSFMIKMSFILFAFFNLMPFILVLAM